MGGQDQPTPRLGRWVRHVCVLPRSRGSSGPGRESSWYTLGIPVGLSPKVLPVKQPLVGT